jgi:hypothetical protein
MSFFDLVFKIPKSKILLGFLGKVPSDPQGWYKELDLVLDKSSPKI